MAVNTDDGSPRRELAMNSGDELTFSCGLCGRNSRPLRRREPAELAASYRGYFGQSLTPELVAKYFTGPNVEFHCGDCDIRWYAPGKLGESDFYEALGEMFAWYYDPDTWDKRAAVAHLVATKARTVVDLGCGNGNFLERLRDHQITGIGIDINRQAVESARAKGLDVFLPGDSPVKSCDVLCLFQTVEHLDQPFEFLQDLVAAHAPQELLISAPTFHSLLGYTSDPLVWPPHHRSAWSHRGFERLAGKLGLRLRNVWYESLAFETFCDLSRREPQGRVPALPNPEGWTGRLVFRAAQRLGLEWASRRHSILVSLGRP